MPRLGGVPVPRLAEDLCTGCGNCVSACPVSAIDVRLLDKTATA
jgi:ferredoxin-type protein NapF